MPRTAKMFVNREPRFYASIGFCHCFWPGSSYLGTETSFKNIEATYYKDGTVQPNAQLPDDKCHSGYTLKKYTNPEDNLKGTNRQKAFPIIRYAEILLNYAEALNESQESPTQDVYDYVDLVRERAGLKGVKESWSKYSKSPDKPNTKNGMREIIRMERLNELACEGKRFWDLRRWKKELPREVKGWHIQGETAQEFYRVTTIYLRSKYSYKDYLWPLKLETILKDPNLVQNPGW